MIVWAFLAAYTIVAAMVMILTVWSWRDSDADDFRDEVAKGPVLFWALAAGLCLLWPLSLPASAIFNRPPRQ